MDLRREILGNKMTGHFIYRTVGLRVFSLLFLLFFPYVCRTKFGQIKC